MDHTDPLSAPATSDTSWEPIRAHGFKHVHPAGVQLFGQQDPASAVILIDQGLVKISRWEQDDRPVVIGIRYPGWLLGAGSAIAGQTQTATAETLTRVVTYSVPAPFFLDLLSRDVEFSMSVHRMHCREMLDQLTRLAGLGSLSAEERLRRLLWELWNAEADGRRPGDYRLRVALTQQQLADIVFTTREHLNRLLKRLEAHGVIRREEGWILLNAPPKL